MWGIHLVMKSSPLICYMTWKLHSNDYSEPTKSHIFWLYSLHICSSFSFSHPPVHFCWHGELWLQIKSTHRMRKPDYCKYASVLSYCRILTIAVTILSAIRLVPAVKYIDLKQSPSYKRSYLTIPAVGQDCCVNWCSASSRCLGYTFDLKTKTCEFWDEALRMEKGRSVGMKLYRTKISECESNKSITNKW